MYINSCRDLCRILPSPQLLLDTYPYYLPFNYSTILYSHGWVCLGRWKGYLEDVYQSLSKCNTTKFRLPRQHILADLSLWLLSNLNNLLTVEILFPHRHEYFCLSSMELHDVSRSGRWGVEREGGMERRWEDGMGVSGYFFKRNVFVFLKWNGVKSLAELIMMFVFGLSNLSWCILLSRSNDQKLCQEWKHLFLLVYLITPVQHLYNMS